MIGLPATRLVLAAAAPNYQPPTKTPGLIFTAVLCLIFTVWGVVVAVLAYRARARRHTLHGGAWAVTGPWTPPPNRLPPPQFAAGPPPRFVGPPPRFVGPPPSPGPQGAPPPPYPGPAGGPQNQH